MARLPAVAIAAVTVLAGCAGSNPVGGEPDPGQLAAGEQVFETYCISCHGPEAAGTDQGPPLVHVVYEPSHHSDDAFRTAVANGAVAHHWDFGPMPPVSGIDDEEVEAVIAYVRALQRDAGIQ